MRDYILHKVISIAIPLLVIAFILILGLPTHETWRILIITIIIYAYTHFAAGAFFQVRGFVRSENALGKFLVFAGLCFLGALISAVFLLSPFFTYFGMFGVGYFMLHGFFNESTLFNRQVGSIMPMSILVVVVLWLTSMAFLSLGHPSALVGPGAHFLPPNVSAFVLKHTEYAATYDLIADVSWFGVVASFFILCFATFKHRQYRVTIGALLIMLLVTFWTLHTGPPSYAIILFLLLGYHFTGWLIFYGIRYYKRKPEWGLIVSLHVIVVLLFLTPFLPMFSDTSLMANIYNINTLSFFSVIHITTSFMNEEWFKNRVLPRLWKT